MSTQTASSNVVSVGFFFPVLRDGKIYLGQRATPPHQKLYGPIGGKSERLSVGMAPMMTTESVFHQAPCIADRISLARGIEYGHLTATREFCEEAFGKQRRIDDIVRLGAIEDTYDGLPQCCQFYLGDVFALPEDFRLNPRELRQMKPLTELSPEQIFPIAKAALEGLRYILTNPLFAFSENHKPYTDLKIAEQIPHFAPEELAEILKDRRTSIIGAIGRENLHLQ